MDIYPNAAIGYRWFLISKGKLKSVGYGRTIWRPGLNDAECKLRAKHHHAPAQDCECGLYAYHDLDYALDNMIAPTRSTEPSQMILAAVRARGDMHIHHHGFRAEQVEVVGLYMPSGWQGEEHRRLAERYQVPLVDRSKELVRLAAAFGLPVPDHARPSNPIRPSQPWWKQIAWVYVLFMIPSCLVMAVYASNGFTDILYAHYGFAAGALVFFLVDKFANLIARYLYRKVRW